MFSLSITCRWTIVLPQAVYQQQLLRRRSSRRHPWLLIIKSELTVSSLLLCCICIIALSFLVSTVQDLLHERWICYFTTCILFNYVFIMLEGNLLSILFYDSPTFRKLFPEYVEKYEQQQLPPQPVPEQVLSVPTGAEKSRPLLEEHDNSTKDEVNRVKPLKDVKNQQRKSIPTWLLLLLVSIFGVVMALPLLQLWWLESCFVHAVKNRPPYIAVDT